MNNKLIKQIIYIDQYISFKNMDTTNQDIA